MSEAQKYFVYVDWTCEPTPRVFYVGYGNAARVKGKRRNKHHTNVRAKYGMTREVVDTFNDEVQAQQREIELIAQHKTFVHATDYVFGCNYSVGGDGSRGHRQPPLSASHLEAIVVANSRPKTVEAKANMKIAARRKAADPLWFEKMQIVALKRWQDPVYRQKRTGMKYNKGAK